MRFLLCCGSLLRRAANNDPQHPEQLEERELNSPPVPSYSAFRVQAGEFRDGVSEISWGRHRRIHVSVVLVEELGVFDDLLGDAVVDAVADEVGREAGVELHGGGSVSKVAGAQPLWRPPVAVPRLGWR